MTRLIGKNYSVYFDTDAVSLSVSGGSFGEDGRATKTATISPESIVSIEL